MIWVREFWTLFMATAFSANSMCIYWRFDKGFNMQWNDIELAEIFATNKSVSRRLIEECDFKTSKTLKSLQASHGRWWRRQSNYCLPKWRQNEMHRHTQKWHICIDIFFSCLLWPIQARIMAFFYCQRTWFLFSSVISLRSQMSRHDEIHSEVFASLIPSSYLFNIIPGKKNPHIYGTKCQTKVNVRAKEERMKRRYENNSKKTKKKTIRINCEWCAKSLEIQLKPWQMKMECAQHLSAFFVPIGIDIDITWLETQKISRQR